MKLLHHASRQAHPSLSSQTFQPLLTTVRPDEKLRYIGARPEKPSQQRGASPLRVRHTRPRLWLGLACEWAPLNPYQSLFPVNRQLHPALLRVLSPCAASPVARAQPAALDYSESQHNPLEVNPPYTCPQCAGDGVLLMLAHASIAGSSVVIDKAGFHGPPLGLCPTPRRKVRHPQQRSTTNVEPSIGSVVVEWETAPGHVP